MTMKITRFVRYNQSTFSHLLIWISYFINYCSYIQLKLAQVDISPIATQYCQHIAMTMKMTRFVRYNQSTFSHLLIWISYFINYCSYIQLKLAQVDISPIATQYCQHNAMTMKITRFVRYNQSTFSHLLIWISYFINYCSYIQLKLAQVDISPIATQYCQHNAMTMKITRFVRYNQSTFSHLLIWISYFINYCSYIQLKLAQVDISPIATQYCQHNAMTMKITRFVRYNQSTFSHLLIWISYFINYCSYIQLKLAQVDILPIATPFCQLNAVTIKITRLVRYNQSTFSHLLIWISFLINYWGT